VKQVLTKCALALLLGNFAASAAIIRILSVDTNRGQNTWTNQNGTDTNSFLGVIRVSLDGAGPLDAFCIDAFVSVSVNDNYAVNLTDPSSAQRQRVAWLLNSQLPTLNALPNGTDKRQRFAALQLTIWDIVHDNGDGFGAGLIRWDTSGTNNTPTNVRTYSDLYRTLSSGQSLANFGWIATHVNGPTVKQTLFVVPNPEPATALLLLPALVLLRLRSRRAAH
jgi:hypothetical protein